MTDANVALGRLNPAALLGGQMKIDAAAAEAAIARHIGTPLDTSVTNAAAGILQIANVGIIGAVRVISVKRGEDPRDCALFAFGGGGPLHAAEVADAMGMRHVIVPIHPGLMSAIGLLAAAAALTGLLARAHVWAEDESLDLATLHINRMLELRYRGQSSEFRIPLPDDSADPLAHAVAAFHANHRRRFGYGMPKQPVEIVTARLTAVAVRPAPPPEPAAAASLHPAPRIRPVWFLATGFVATPVHDRDAIRREDRIAGPAIIEQMDTTTVVPPGWTATMDIASNLLLTREAS